MSTRRPALDATTRTFHPRALTTLGAPACIAMLSVARDLRSGAISPREYNQKRYCGSSCCISGHTALRLERNQTDWLNETANKDDEGFSRLVAGSQPSDPRLAARAIERYLYKGAEQPWGGLI